jgi:hypothetical protein
MTGPETITFTLSEASTDFAVGDYPYQPAEERKAA